MLFFQDLLVAKLDNINLNVLFNHIFNVVIIIFGGGGSWSD